MKIFIIHQFSITAYPALMVSGASDSISVILGRRQSKISQIQWKVIIL